MTVSRMRRVAVALSVAVSLIACGRDTAADHAGATTSVATTSVATTSVVTNVPNAADAGAAMPKPVSDTVSVSAPAPTLADTLDPVATLRTYLARARMHRATRDTLIWEPGADGTNGFRAFTDSVITTFTIGSAGRIDAAAGSRYVEIPVDVDVMAAAAPATPPVTLHGTATLRRAVVDGASEAQRRWRIMRIEWGTPR